jgi:hypothetical protein
MMKRPIRETKMTEVKEDVMVKPERDCTRKSQGVLIEISLTIAVMML